MLDDQQRRGDSSLEVGEDAGEWWNCATKEWTVDDTRWLKESAPFAPLPTLQIGTATYGRNPPRKRERP